MAITTVLSAFVRVNGAIDSVDSVIHRQQCTFKITSWVQCDENQVKW